MTRERNYSKIKETLDALGRKDTLFHRRDTPNHLAVYQLLEDADFILTSNNIGGRIYNSRNFGECHLSIMVNVGPDYVEVQYSAKTHPLGRYTFDLALGEYIAESLELTILNIIDRVSKSYEET